MIQIPNKISATTLYFPVNIDKNTANSYVLTLKTESYENTFTKSIQDIGDSSKYIKATVEFNDIPDGEYGYIIDNNGIIYSDGLICIGDYEDGEIVYNYSSTFYEYDPEKGEGAVVNPLNLASLSVSYSANSAYTVTTPSNFDGIRKVDITVNVAQTGYTEEDLEEAYAEGIEEQKSKLSGGTFSTNGTYTRADGYSAVTVNVPAPNLQNKNVSISQTAVTITADEGYDGLNSVGINAQNIYMAGQTVGYTNGYYDGEIDQKDKLISTAFTENGNYYREDGYSDITVNVPIPTYTSQSKNYSITANGSTNITVDSGYDGITGGTISVNVPKSVSLQSKSISLTGISETVTADSGYDGLSQVDIDAKDVYDQGVADQKAAMVATAITANGTYSRVDGYSSINVNVQEQKEEEAFNATYTSNNSYSIVPTQGKVITGGTITVNVPSTHILQNKNVNLSETAATITADAGYDGLSQVNINAENVWLAGNTAGYDSGMADGIEEGKAQQKALLASTAITSNGTYTRENGWNEVTVNCPTPKEEETYTSTITANGTHTITPTANKVITGGTISVNVPTTSVVTLTQAQYDALTVKDNNTIYLING